MFHYANSSIKFIEPAVSDAARNLQDECILSLLYHCCFFYAGHVSIFVKNIRNSCFAGNVFSFTAVSSVTSTGNGGGGVYDDR